MTNLNLNLRAAVKNAAIVLNDLNAVMNVSQRAQDAALERIAGKLEAAQDAAEQRFKVALDKIETANGGMLDDAALDMLDAMTEQVELETQLRLRAMCYVRRGRMISKQISENKAKDRRAKFAAQAQ